MVKRYTSRGIGIDQQSPISVSNIQESIRSSQSLEARLDRIGDIAFGKAKEDAIKRGQEYAANNRPTVQQYIDAANSEEPSDIFAKGGNIAGDEARRLQAIYLSQDLMNEMDTSFAALRQQIEDDPDVDLDALSVEINAMIDGMANVIGQGNRDEEVSFRAKASKKGFDVISKGVEAKKKFDDEVHKAKAFKKQENLRGELNDLIKRDRDPISLAASLTLLEKDHENFYKRDMDTYADNMLNFSKIRDDAVKSVMADRLIELEMIDEFVAGEVIPDLGVLRMLGMDTSAQRNEIAKIATDRLVNKINAKENENKAKRLEKQAQEIELHTKWANNEITPTEYLKQRVALKIPTDDKQIDAILNRKDPTRDQITTYDTLEAQIISGEAGPRIINNLAISGRITPLQEANAKKLWQDQTSNHVDESRIIRGRFSLNEADVADVIKNKKLKMAYTNAIAEFTKKAQEARVNQEPFDSFAVAEEIANKYYTAFNNEQIQNVIDKRVKDIFTQANIPFDREKFIADESYIDGLVGSDGKRFPGNIYEDLKAQRARIIKYINIGFGIEDEEEDAKK
jgi:hypothetical protein